MEDPKDKERTKSHESNTKSCKDQQSKVLSLCLKQGLNREIITW